MFILDVIKATQAQGELKTTYKMIEKMLGYIPPHFELFGTIDVQALKEFIRYNTKIQANKKIGQDLLIHLRLEIAKKECRNYCINLNTKMLENMQEKELSQEKKFLKEMVLKALYNANTFNRDDLLLLDKKGVSHKDFFELLEYATTFMAKSKIIEVYLK